MRFKMPLLFACLLSFASGCGTSVTVVPTNTPSVKLRPRPGDEVAVIRVGGAATSILAPEHRPTTGSTACRFADAGAADR
jgi:hypothetical protein